MEYIQRIFSPSGIIAILKEQNLSLKERYGQNLLINRDLAAQIIQSSNIKNNDIVLEIGPGLGSLTFSMAGHTKYVVACEVDRGFAKFLEKKAQQLGVKNLCVINRDFLKLGEDDFPDNFRPNKAVSNFPYNIAIKGIIKIIEEFPWIKRITGTVQEEIAQRITAKPGSKSYSYVSVWIQSMAKVEYIIKKIAPSNFFPEPKIHSAVITIAPFEEHLSINPGLFKRIVKQGFVNRRKSLINNLSSLGIDKGRLRAITTELFHDERVRAEELSVKDFAALCETVSLCLQES
ncbi:MAG: ribosomal RNA small subunit methyltransferase A [Spirochaetota bacterium]|nr:MAG: ribosomal RNA small subunit methyltransferase A [Spirochaetota bacterium]